MARVKHKKACRSCKHLMREGNVCPICGSTSFSTKWIGYVYIIDPSGELGKMLEVKAEGEYAIVVS
jgi:DNA-directed RNA polymerase subunit E"